MKINKLLRMLLASLVLLLGLGAAGAWADEGDPSGRVARLSVAEGKVSFQPSGEQDWSEPVINRPLTTGDRLYADQGARAELEVGPFVVRLGQATDVTIANLNDQIMQLGLSQGALEVTVYDMPAGNSVEIDTPNGALIIQQPGSYRVDTAADGNSSEVVVNNGALQISAGDLSQTVQSGQAVQLSGTGPVTATLVSMPARDEFDAWYEGRDRQVQSSPSVRAVGRDVPGCDDLDRAGRWEDSPEYGRVWYPSVAPDWVPYRFGHWAFIEPWGWTWVEDEPWGYAPFHYGRWAHIGPLWAWVPGPIMARAVYAPALVAFVGGPRFGIGIGFGVQAWFPLGPREPFVPWYHYGPTYVRRVNVNVTNINVTNINVTNINYVNRQRAVTAVSGDVFRGGQPVARGLVRVNPEQIQRAEVIAHPGVNPTPRSVLGPRVVTPPPVRTVRFNPTPAGRAAAAATFQRPLAPQTPGTVPRNNTMTVRPPVNSPRAGGTEPQVMRVPTQNPQETYRPNSTPYEPRDMVRPGGAPPNTPPRNVFTRTAPSPTNAPFSARQDAYSSHPGRPLEPQQMNNVRSGRPAGPSQDKETLPHAPRSSPPPREQSKPAPSEGKRH